MGGGRGEVLRDLGAYLPDGLSWSLSDCRKLEDRGDGGVGACDGILGAGPESRVRLARSC